MHSTRFDRNIDGPCEGIFLEAARLEDESAPRQEELERTLAKKVA